jgi:hypothetical protein
MSKTFASAHGAKVISDEIYAASCGVPEDWKYNPLDVTYVTRDFAFKFEEQNNDCLVTVVSKESYGLRRQKFFMSSVNVFRRNNINEILKDAKAMLEFRKPYYEDDELF